MREVSGPRCAAGVCLSMWAPSWTATAAGHVRWECRTRAWVIRYGAEHVEDALLWCERVGVNYVTLFICSAENLLRRDDAEVAYLMDVVEQVVTRQLAQPGARWQVHVAGMLDVPPDSTARALKAAVESTRDCATGSHVTLAVGYGSRQEVVDATRSLLLSHASQGGSMAELAGCRTFCSGRPRSLSCTSARRTGLRSERLTCCAPSEGSVSDTAGTVPNRCVGATV